VKLAALSDIHGNLPALQAVAAEAAADGATHFVNLGDIVSGPLWPAETAAWLMARGWPTIAGNHERQLFDPHPGASDAHAVQRLSAAQRAWLAGLPQQLAVAPGLLCCHGTPTSDLHYLMETVSPTQGLRAATPAELAQRLAGADGAAAVLCGHSHVARAAHCGATLVANPGSVGLQAYDDHLPHPHRVEMHSPHARWAMLTPGASGWQVQLRQTVYDWAAAAAQAQANGRPDWADALATGRVGRSFCGAPA
jgi:predicted phosphodiesterase